MNDEYIRKLQELERLLQELERLSDDLMCYKLAFESPLVQIVGQEDRHYNILLHASQFAKKEIERVRELQKETL